MLVTRVEEWCVEAKTIEEARALLAAGAGHRCTPGERVQAEIEDFLDE
jgi:2-methylisocitrate lyase-like PEP mutase family enzyme